MGLEAWLILAGEPLAKMRDAPPASQPLDHLEVTRSSFIDTFELNEFRILFQQNNELSAIINFRKFHTVHLVHMSRGPYVQDMFLNFSNKH